MGNTRKERITKLVVIIGLVVVPLAAHAHGKATGIVRERMDLMTAIGDAVKTVAGMVRGTTEFDGERAAAAAREIANHANGMTALFPADNANQHSEALPAIWDNWTEFEKIANELNVTADKLAISAMNATSSDQIQPAFSAMGKTCGACHEKFRIKK